jgi:tRNA threonylcarbamoyladenosine modification (KEOPS) complex Cgi121 subunit
LLVERNKYFERGLWMMYNALEFGLKPVLSVCGSSKGMNELIEDSKKASQGGEFVLLLDNKEKLVKRILPAFMNAAIRIGDRIARSDTIQMEMLLLLCGTMKIDKAIKNCGAKDSNNFLLFSTNNSLLSKFAKKNRIRILRKIDLELDAKTAGEVAMTELLGE